MDRGCCWGGAEHCWWELTEPSLPHWQDGGGRAVGSCTVEYECRGGLQGGRVCQ